MKRIVRRFIARFRKSPDDSSFDARTLKFCPACKEEGRHSEVAIDFGDGMMGHTNGGTQFWDGRGELHHHDGTWGAFYRCNRGHRFFHGGDVGCPTCEDGAHPMTVMLHDEDVRWL